MTSPAVEARSLSSLTALASNPPAYPRNPTHVRHDPLVLYIARVPGSKDVFLSPMKPREKVVTAEDIQSSLYYVHVDQPEDVNLVGPPVFQEPDYSGQPQSTPNQSLPPVQRKAVPGTGPGVPVRKPVGGTLTPMNNYDSMQNANAGNYTRRPNLLGPEYNARRSFDSTQNRQENLRPAAPRGYSDRPQFSGTTFTLIRRDPGSSAQWNVARIEDPRVVDISSSNMDDSGTRRRIGAPMYIEILNPGYSKFLHANNAERAIDPSHQSVQPERETNNESSLTKNTFRRRIWMEGSQYSSGGFGHRKNSSYDYSAGQSNVRDGYGTPSFVTNDNQSYNTIQISDRQTSFRGYVFMSPWNSRCEFVTGAAGGSLKCRHLVPGLQGAPPVTMQVSELRFNLPSSSKAATPRGEETSKRSSFFHRGRHSRNNSSVSVNRNDSVEDVRNPLDRLDLSLGQEFAGGGFGGKQAKLGKIIIEDEGLKMMDLLVAANLGLWWRAYEKASTVSRGDRGSF